MTHRMRNRLVQIFMLFMLAAAGAALMPRVHAAVIGTDQVVQSERERVKAALERPDVVQALKKMGVDADHAASRVDAMSDAEVAQISNLVDLLPAGGQAFTNQQLIIILLIVLILVIAL
ncbi:MAG TPA: PA2779 family protein [Burkholderiales bacterium]|jgi:uncharacterized protein YpuA (DUF1002 family)|nr:PA2779 family protein [Burkholderiales bacterium]